MTLRLKVGKCYSMKMHSHEYVRIVHELRSNLPYTYIGICTDSSADTEYYVRMFNSNGECNTLGPDIDAEIPDPRVPVVIGQSPYGSISNVASVPFNFTPAVEGYINGLGFPKTISVIDKKSKCDCGGDMTKMPHYNWCSSVRGPK